MSSGAHAATLHWDLAERYAQGFHPTIINWTQVIDQIGGVVLVLFVRLNFAIGILGAGQQCVLTRLIRRGPIISKRRLHPVNRIYEF